MLKSCPNCGAAIAPDARFCRQCGRAQRAGAASNDNPDAVSPIASTILLSKMGRPTDGLTADDSQRTTPATARVNRAELDALLRASQPAEPPPPTQNSEPTVISQQSYRNDPSSTAGPEANLAAPESFVARTRANDDEGAEEQTRLAIQFGEHGVGSDKLADEDEDLTILAARPKVHSSPATSVVAVPVTRTLAFQTTTTSTSAPEASPPTSRPAAVASSTTTGGSATEARAQKIWLIAALASVLLLCCTVFAGWLVINYFRKPVMVVGTGELSPIPMIDAKQQFDEKVAEAESLLAAGDLNGAIASLREANQLDSSNTKARWRLADILRESGRRREAIDEYRAITANDPHDRAVWRALASAQGAENLRNEAIESYRRLLALTSRADTDPHDLLAYADALRRAEFNDEAQRIYGELVTSPTAEIASVARERLAELAAQLPATRGAPISPAVAHAREARSEEIDSVSALPSPLVPLIPAPTPTPPAPTPNTALPPAQRYARGIELWSSNRAAAVTEFRAAAGSNPDAYYYLGLSIAEGRAPRTLQRAELGAALQYFQNAKRGRFRVEAERYENLLGAEFDRRRNE